MIKYLRKGFNCKLFIRYLKGLIINIGFLILNYLYIFVNSKFVVYDVLYL